MSYHVFYVCIYHVFFKSVKEPIRFASKDELYAEIEECIYGTGDYTQRPFEFKTLEEAQRKANEIKFDGYWKCDEGYSKPFKWYFLAMEVAKIEEIEILDNGDLGDEVVWESEYFLPNIPIDDYLRP